MLKGRQEQDNLFDVATPKHWVNRETTLILGWPPSWSTYEAALAKEVGFGSGSEEPKHKASTFSGPGLLASVRQVQSSVSQHDVDLFRTQAVCDYPQVPSLRLSTLTRLRKRISFSCCRISEVVDMMSALQPSDERTRVAMCDREWLLAATLPRQGLEELFGTI